MKGKYIITTDNWFYAPDGLQYRAVWGDVEVLEDSFLGIKTNRNTSNWFIKVGDEKNHVLVAGCNIHYAARCETVPTIQLETVDGKESPSAIYCANRLDDMVTTPAAEPEPTSEPTTEVYRVKESDLVGEIKGFPLEIVQLMVQRQFEQMGECDVSVFQYKRNLNVNGRGFTWEITPEQHTFWINVILYRDFDVFYEKYPHLKTEK